VSRDPGLYLQDILAACSKVLILAKDLDLKAFSDDWRTRDAVLHNLEVAGEAVKRLPADIIAAYPEIPWKPSPASGMCWPTPVFRFSTDLSEGLDPHSLWQVSWEDPGSAF